MKKLIPIILSVIVAIAALSIYAFKGKSPEKSPSSTTTSAPTPRTAESTDDPATLINPRTHQKSPSLSDKKEDTKDPVSLRSQSDEHSFILSADLNDAQTIAIKALGARITPSKAGRTGPVLRIKSSDVAATKKLLVDSGITLSGQLIELSMTIDPVHENCGTCLIKNRTIISQIDGVLNIPRYLGDPEASEVDIVIDSEKTSATAILTVLNSIDTSAPH